MVILMKERITHMPREERMAALQDEMLDDGQQIIQPFQHSKIERRSSHLPSLGTEFLSRSTLRIKATELTRVANSQSEPIEITVRQSPPGELNPLEEHLRDKRYDLLQQFAEMHLSGK